MAWERSGNLNLKKPDVRRRTIPEGWFASHLDDIAANSELAGAPITGIYIAHEDGSFHYYKRQKG